MTQFVWTNFFNTTLAVALTSSATTITVASTTNLPASIPSGEYLAVVLNDEATRSVFEVVYATAISGASLTVIRGQEGTGAVAWNVGDYVRASNTAGVMNSLANVNGSASESFTGSTLTGAFITSTGDVSADGSVSAGGTLLANGGLMYIDGNVGGGPGINFEANSFITQLSGGLSYNSSTGGTHLFNAGLQANGTILAQGGRLRASDGAYETGDVNAATLLGDFAFVGGSAGYVRLPNGFILQWGFTNSIGIGTQAQTFVIAFPNACLSVVATDTYGGSAPGQTTFGVGSLSKTGFNLGSSGPASVASAYWWALGY